MSGNNQPPRQIILGDELGGQWAISVRPDGQLQTAQWPDGEPVAVGNISVDRVTEILQNEMVAVFNGYLDEPSPAGLQAGMQVAQAQLDSPNASHTAKRAARRYIDDATAQIEKLSAVESQDATRD